MRAGAAGCGRRRRQRSARAFICPRGRRFGGASGRRGRVGMGALALKFDSLKKFAETCRGEECSSRASIHNQRGAGKLPVGKKSLGRDSASKMLPLPS